jgi:hypothetical protein
MRIVRFSNISSLTSLEIYQPYDEDSYFSKGDNAMLYVVGYLIAAAAVQRKLRQEPENKVKEDQDKRRMRLKY